MHELSIASSILTVARQHVPDGRVLRAVRIRAGPLRGIEPQALEWAWRATVAGTDVVAASIHLELLPWQLRCARCGATFPAADPYSPCVCGSSACHPIGGDELTIASIEVDWPACPGGCNESVGGRERAEAQ